MEYEHQLLWIIPNDNYIEKKLEDGKPIFYQFVLGDRDHRTKTTDFCKKYGFTGYPEGGSHTDWGKYFIELGFAVFFNSAVTIDKKYFGGIYLPKQLTSKQITFFEEQKKLFYDKYHTSSSFFDAAVLPDGNLSYRSTNGLRDLKIEAIINGKSPENGIDLFYEELELQKSKLTNIKK